MKLRWLVRQQPDLVDRERLDPVVLPIIRMPGQRSFGEQRSGEGTRGDRLAESGLTNEQVGVGETLRLELRAKLGQRLAVADDAGERIGHGMCVGAAWRALAFSRSRSRRWARPCSHTSRMRCSAVMLVMIASRNTTP